jgi:hypothetical protein
MTGHRSLLLSLRPRFADAILSGTASGHEKIRVCGQLGPGLRT